MVNKLVGIVVAGLPLLAYGQPQPAAPQLPSNPTSPTDFQAAARAPAPAGEAKPAAAASGGGAAGYDGGDNMMYDANPALYGEDSARPAGPIPEYHLVKEGETLWGLCQYYYGDPWTWPRLWAKNRSITNPHWIYPGDKVRMIGGKPGVTSGAAAVAAGDGGGPATRGRYSGSGRRVVRQEAFLESGEVEKAGIIAGSKREARMLATTDEAYIRETEGFRPTAGKKYTVFRRKQVLRGLDGKVLGNVVEVLGSIQIKRVNDRKVATGVITASYSPIERGHLVGELPREYKQVPMAPAQIDLKARLVGAFRDVKMFRVDDLVFIDRGRSAGVRLGNRFLVLRQGDGYRRNIVDDVKYDPDFPDEVVAEITVLDLRDNMAVGLVTRAIKELRIGERLRLRRGY